MESNAISGVLLGFGLVSLAWVAIEVCSLLISDHNSNDVGQGDDDNNDSQNGGVQWR